MFKADVDDQNIGLWVKGIPYFLSTQGYIPVRDHVPNDVMTKLPACDYVNKIYKVMKGKGEVWSNPVRVTDLLCARAPRLEGRVQYFLRGSTPRGSVRATKEEIFSCTCQGSNYDVFWCLV